MPKFTVSYETDIKPSLWALPADAKVEQVTKLPLVLDVREPYSTVTKSFKVDRSIYPDSVAYVKVGDGFGGVWLSKSQVYKVIDALKETVEGG